jgi:hypothetical protein
MPFKYNEKTDKEWFMIPLHNGSPLSRAWIQDYARCMNVTEDAWVQDALVWFMHECDRQGAHGKKDDTPVDPYAGYTKRAQWRISLSEWLHGLAEKVVGFEDA